MPTNGSVSSPDMLLKARPPTWGTRRVADWANSPDGMPRARLGASLSTKPLGEMLRKVLGITVIEVKAAESAPFLRHTSRDHTVFDSE